MDVQSKLAKNDIASDLCSEGDGFQPRKKHRPP
jgi:hypothetical protein